MNCTETNYTSPWIRVVRVNACQVICGSALTEKFNMSGNEYEEEDWE